MMPLRFGAFPRTVRAQRSRLRDAPQNALNEPENCECGRENSRYGQAAGNRNDGFVLLAAALFEKVLAGYLRLTVTR
jgi:hypothetical protein